MWKDFDYVGVIHCSGYDRGECNYCKKTTNVAVADDGGRICPDCYKRLFYVEGDEEI